MTLTPLIAVHATAATGALVLGPFALWARLGRIQRPILHRALGYAWVTLMILAAGSAIFIRDREIPNIWGYTPIHLFVALTAYGLVGAFWSLAEGRIDAHRRYMQSLYLGACVTAGVFTLLPGRLIGGWLWKDVFGL